MESFLFTLIKFLHFCTEYFLQCLPTLNCDIYSLLHNVICVKLPCMHMYAHLMSVYPESIRQDEKMTSGRHIFFTLFSIQPVRERATQPRSTAQCCSMHCCLDTTSPNQAWDGTQQKTPDVGDEAYAAPGHLKPSVLFTSKNRT